MKEEEETLDKHSGGFSVTELKDVIDQFGEERSKRLEKQAQCLKLPAEQKTTVAAWLRSYPTTVQSLRRLGEEESNLAWEFAKDTKSGHVEPEYILDLTKDIHRLGDKSTLEYVIRNRTILLSEHAIKIKQQDIHRMKELGEKFEEQILKEEEKLETDACNFNDFIKNSDALSRQAVKEAIHETKRKFEKVEQLRRVNADIFLLKSQMMKLERLLSEFLLYSHFLKTAAKKDPEDKELDSAESKQEGKRRGISKNDAPDDEIEFTKSKFVLDSLMDANESFDPIALPFKEPEELLKVISHFRDRNLTLITNSHYIRNSLEEANRTFLLVKDKIEKELEMYGKQIETLQWDIHRYEEKAKRLEQLSGLSSCSEEDDERLLLQKLTAKVISTYKLCTGVGGGKINLTMMVSTIEYFLVDLLHDIQRLPEKKLLKMYKLKQVERKSQKRKEEEEQRAKLMEERLKKADLRRFDSGKAKLKRRLLYRPPPMKRVSIKKETPKLSQEEEDEEYDYFFT